MISSKDGVLSSLDRSSNKGSVTSEIVLLILSSFFNISFLSVRLIPSSSTWSTDLVSLDALTDEVIVFLEADFFRPFNLTESVTVPVPDFRLKGCGGEYSMFSLLIMSEIVMLS